MSCCSSRAKTETKEGDPKEAEPPAPKLNDKEFIIQQAKKAKKELQILINNLRWDGGRKEGTASPRSEDNEA